MRRISLCDRLNLFSILFMLCCAMDGDSEEKIMDEKEMQEQLRELLKLKWYEKITIPIVVKWYELKSFLNKKS